MKMEDGWRKIGQRGGSYVVATLYNVFTHEVKTKCVRDYDYSDCSRDDDFWYYQPIDEEALAQHNRHNRIVCKGATVKVVKGRKVPIGTVDVVCEMKPMYDRYGRFVASYVVLQNGMSTNASNVERVD